MLKKMTVSALAAMLLMGTMSAYAANVDPSAKAFRHFDEYEHCKNLAVKFDSYVQNHSDAKNIDRAKELRNQGQQAWNDADFLYGTHSLEQALLDIGITPPAAHFF